MINLTQLGKYLFFPALSVFLLILSYLVYHVDEVFVVLAVIVAVLTLLALKWPEAATLAVIFVLYTNLAAIAKQLYGVPQIVAASFTLLLCLPLTNYLFIRGQKLVIDHVFMLMVVFLAVLLTSSLFAKNMDIAFNWIIEYIAEGIVLYFLIINVVRNLKILKKVVWTLLFCGSLLGGLSLYQDVTRSYDNDFFGLAQRKIEMEYGQLDEDALYEDNSGLIRTRMKVGGTDRAGGPFGMSNRYAQIMLVLLPLALFLYWGRESQRIRICAAIAAMLILAGIMLSYSRGAFVTLVLMLIMLTFLRYVQMRQIAVFVVIFVVFMFVAAPGYMVRIETLLGVEGLVSHEAAKKPDAVTRGRLTEMLAAFLAFIDHPLLGVGPGQYTPYYSVKYQMDPDIAFRHLPTNRRAHTLYSELAAETGIFGILTFMGIVALVMFQLWKIRRVSWQIRPDISYLATAFWFGIFGYLGTAIFLHLAYQRYYWFILALSGAAVQIFREELRNSKSEQNQVETSEPPKVAKGTPDFSNIVNGNPGSGM